MSCSPGVHGFDLLPYQNNGTSFVVCAPTPTFKFWGNKVKAFSLRMFLTLRVDSRPHCRILDAQVSFGGYPCQKVDVVWFENLKSLW